jgi:hypothetical protein
MALKKELFQKLVASLLSRPALSDGRGGGVAASQGGCDTCPCAEPISGGRDLADGRAGGPARQR